MSGHSKWAGIKHRKAAVDAKRGKIFTRHAKLVEIAAREGGGGDPESNARLRTAIDNAKTDNVPNANIERAIKNGAGELKGGTSAEHVTYEAFGPSGTAYLIECLTDNKNRTHSAVKAVLSRNGGRLAESGSVAWMFGQKGVVTAKCETQLRFAEAAKGKNAKREELELALIDAGAEDIDADGETIEVTTDRDAWPPMRDILKGAGCEIRTAGLTFIPRQPVRISEAATAKKILDLMEALEADEDVAEVHTNAEIDEEIGKALQ